MQKRVLSKDELDTVIKLKQAGASWLRIQKETGIPRQAARRAYDDLQRSQSMEQFQQVRISIATEEFHRHLNWLTRLAELLLDFLHVPTSPDESRDAEEVLHDLLLQDIRSEIEPSDRTSERTERQTQRLIRDNGLLLKSLQGHTSKAVHWKVLEEWKQAWDRCLARLSEINQEASEIKNNILEQKPGLAKRIVKESGEENALEKIQKGILEAVWRAVLSDEPYTAPDLVQIGSYGGKYTSVIIGERDAIATLSFEDKKLTKQVAEIVRQAATNLSRGDQVSKALSEVRSIRNSIGKLEEELSPLKLLPVLLQTRCDLCPV